MRMVEGNTTLVEHREKEIQSIVQSISELNEIFRDLATMVVEQVGYHFCDKVFFLIRPANEHYNVVFFPCL